MGYLSDGELLSIASDLADIYRRHSGTPASYRVLRARRHASGKVKYTVEIEVDGKTLLLLISCRDYRDYCSAALYVDGIWRTECSTHCTGDYARDLEALLNKHVTNINGGKFGEEDD